MNATKSIPIRSCIACKAKRPKSELKRYVLIDDFVIEDKEQCAPGRGAYLCPSPTCLVLAIKRRAFQKAFRFKGQLMVNHLKEGA